MEEIKNGVQEECERHLPRLKRIGFHYGSGLVTEEVFSSEHEAIAGETVKNCTQLSDYLCIRL
jgi:hypothetical protein